MMKRRYFNVAMVCVYLTVGVSAGLSQAPSRTGELTPGGGKVEFENESMIVLRMHIAPREKTPMHDIVSPRLVIWLTDAHLKDTGPDGRSNEYSRTSGSIDWITPRRHMGENLSDRTIDFLAIIPKVAAGPTSQRTSPH
jgi:hypothetical protein